MAVSDPRKMRELLEQGLPTDEVAAQLDVPRGSVAAVLANMNRGKSPAPAGPRPLGGIYLRRNGDLIPMVERPYDSEDALQALLADHPGLLAGEDVGDAPRQWVLLSREVGVADQADAAGRWALDHLFVDQDAIPTLVEVKRSSDTRIRREVVGQLLEYAANGTRYWPVEQLRGIFESRCRERHLEPDVVLLDTFGEDTDADAWWTQVAENLSRGSLRLVFVADVISRELRQIIEFLNEQMTETEVLGVEIRQYVDDQGEHQTLVPRLVGQTERARTTKTRRARREWDQPKLLADIARQKGNDAAAVAEKLFDWAAEHPSVTFDFGKGANAGQATFGLQGDAALTAFRLWSDGGVQIPFWFMAGQAPFSKRDMRDELRGRISDALPNKTLAPEEKSKEPRFWITELIEPSVLDTFVGAVEWAVQKAREAQTGSLKNSV
jgi:hypothetical protein